MNEIRFNQPIPQDKPFRGAPDINTEEKKKRNFLFGFKKLLKFFIAIIILGSLVFAVFTNRTSLMGVFGNKNNVYNAVFLTNGEVYFGKIVKEDSGQIVLKEVFYLQANKAETTGQSVDNKMILAKLQQQFHGPTDELFINRTQVIFYEKLRDDSKVVESIKNYKAQ